MRLIRRLRTYFNIIRLRRYMRKKLAYHEAGHLIFSYLFKIPCEYISVDLYFEEKIRFEGEFLVVTMNSRSQVYHILPNEIEKNLNNVRLGIDRIAALDGKNVEIIKERFIIYFTILLSGHYSQSKFSESFKRDDLEYLQYACSQDLTQKNLQEDVTRFNYLNKNLNSIVSDRIKTFKTVQDLIFYYLEQNEIQQAIKTIANTVKGNKKLGRRSIEKRLNKIGFLDYCETEYTKAIKLMQ